MYKKLILWAVGASVLLAATLLPATTASADDTYNGETYCGTTLSGSSPAQNPTGAFNDMTNDFYDSWLQKLGGSDTLCGPYHWLINQGAKRIVPNGVKNFTKVYRAANGMQGQAGGVGNVTELPRAGVDSPRTYPVAWTGGQGLWLVGGPSVSAPTIRLMPDGTQVTIMCQRQGDAVGNGVAVTTLWDQVAIPEADGTTTIGWATDAFINTSSDGQVAPTCA